jgi:hypothetical protein
MAVLAGCDGEGVTRPPPTDVAFFNAAANIEAIGFFREESLEVDLAYSQGSVARFDSGSYDFSLDYTLVGATTPPRALTQPLTLASDVNYTFVAVAPEGDFKLIVTETDDREAGAATARWTFIHAFPGLGALDVYVEPIDTILSSATPKGTVAYEGSTTFEFTSGIYQVWLTGSGDPNDIVFESSAQGPVAGEDQIFVVSDPGEQGTFDIVVSRIGSSAFRLGQEGQTSELRVVQVVADRQDRDIYLDETTGTPLFAALPFGEISAYEEVPLGTHTAITTPAGNPGAEESTSTYFAGPGLRYLILVSGDTTDGIGQIFIAEDKRSISGQATVRLLNGAESFFVLHVYFAAPGADISELPPTIEILSPDATNRVPLIPGDYEIWVRNPITDTVLAGPLAVTMADGGFYGILVADAVGGSTVDLVLFDDFIP